MAGSLRLSALAFAAALLLPAAVLSAEPPCAVQNKGYVDPNVTVVNGGLPVIDAETCQRTCAGLTTCKVFTYYINSGGCWLQGLSGVMPPLQDLPGVWSGPKNCSDANITDAASTDDSLVTIVALSTEAPVADVIPAGTGSAVNETSKGAGASVQADEKATSSSSDYSVLLVVCALLAATGAVVFGLYACFQKEKRGAKKSRRTRKADIEEASRNSDEVPLVLAEAAAPVAAVAAAPVATMATPQVQARSIGPLIQPPAVPVPQAMPQAVPQAYAPQVPAMAFAPAAPVVAAPMPQGILTPSPQGVVTPAQPASAVQSVQSVQSMTWATAMEPVATPAMPMVRREPIAVSSPPQDLFDRLDRNHDGVLTRAEFNQFAGGMR